MAVKSPWMLVGWVLGVLNLCSLASGFAHHHHCIMKSAPSSALLRNKHRPCCRDRDTVVLRLAPQQEQQEKDDVATSRSSVSEFEQTSGPVKAFVGGLTDLFVLFSGGDNKAETLFPPAAPKATLSVEQLEAGIRQEYEKNYLWTGDINEDLYEEDCSFTDPTLSFSGLSTYKRNVGSLQGVLDRLVSNSRSVLYSCEPQQDQSCVQTRWRMVGDLRLPWGPTIDVVGRTTFSYDAGRGNRIFSYDEVWEVEPAEALLQFFKPGKRRDEPLLSQE